MVDMMKKRVEAALLDDDAVLGGVFSDDRRRNAEVLGEIAVHIGPG